MSVSVIVRVSCDASVAKAGSKIKKKCGRHDEFEAANVFAAKKAAIDAGWCFTMRYTKDIILCPDCGPEIMPHYYGKRHE